MSEKLCSAKEVKFLLSILSSISALESSASVPGSHFELRLTVSQLISGISDRIIQDHALVLQEPLLAELPKAAGWVQDGPVEAQQGLKDGSSSVPKHVRLKLLKRVRHSLKATKLFRSGDFLFSLRIC